MKAKEIREILKKNDYCVLDDGMERDLDRELLSNEEDFVLVDGDKEYKFISVGCERENELYFFRYQLGEQYFEWHGEYDSWQGITLECPLNFEEVKPVETVVTVWKAV